MTRATSSFARLLRYYRLAAGFTQEELAERSRLSARAISDLERGVKALPHRHTVELLAAALDLSVDDLERAVARRRGPRSTRGTTTLPIPPTSFVGRDAEIRDVTTRLRQPGTRLLTVTGPPGIGKTRLVLAAAESIAGEFADGAAFVPLAPIRDPAFVCSALAQAVGVQLSDSELVEKQLVDHLRAKHVLLVVDNFEHVLDAASVLAQILTSCPRIKLLISSRAALKIQGEHRIDLGPLDIPTPGDTPSLGDRSPFSALQLYTERARAANPSFHITPNNFASIVAICRRLNGLPLAIELASARANILSPPELLQRLDSQLQVLTGGPRDLPERHQTMRRAIAWSYELLNERERRLFRRLAYCAGGFSVGTAEAIAGVGDDATHSVLDDLSSLVDKSLVMAMPGDFGEVRFTMLEVVREFGLEQLVESGEFESTAELHCDYFVILLEHSYLEQVGKQQSHWFRRLEERQGNIRLAGRRIVEKGDGSRAVRFGLALWRFWERGHIQEGRDWLNAFLRIPALTSPNPNRAPLLFAAGRLAYRQADYGSAAAHLEESLSIARNGNDEDFTCAALTQLGHVAYALGNLSVAEQHYSESLAMRRKEGDVRTIAVTLHGLARVQRARGDYAGARELLIERLILSRAAQDAVQITMAMAGLGLIALLEGDLAEADRCYRDSLTRSLEVGDQPAVAIALLGLAFVSIARSEPRQARPLLEDSLLISREIGARHLTTLCLEGLAAMLACAGRSRQSWRLFAAVAAYRERVAIPGDPGENTLIRSFRERAAQSLDDEERDRIWASGSTMTVQNALDETGLTIPHQKRDRPIVSLIDAQSLELEA